MSKIKQMLIDPDPQTLKEFKQKTGRFYKRKSLTPLQAYSILYSRNKEGTT